MNAPQIKTSKQIIPMVYAYSTPEVARHNGWTKIGFTEQGVDKRIKQQAHTVDVKTVELWRGMAVYDDGSGDTFSDVEFHAYLKKKGIEREKATEWFHIDGPTSQRLFDDFRRNRGFVKPMETVIPYELRQEQKQAVQEAFDYRKTHHKGEFLWNAKPRFGKTLSLYDLAKRMGAKKVLIVTNRPSIANSWFDDYAKFMGVESGYLFVSEVSGLKGRQGVLSRSEYVEALSQPQFEHMEGCIEFISLQDLKGSKYFGGKFDKLHEIAQLDWDLLVIDEAHEGVDTLKTDVAFDQIKRKFTLHLSGTPFKALANDKFEGSAIFNWTYADEQRMKHNWDDSQGPNPYANLPQLNMFTYKMSDIVEDLLKNPAGLEFDNYAFDLNEFFATNNGRFTHNDSVDRFLDALTTQKQFPFSTPELRNELKHTLWLLDRVDSATALAKKLKNHPVFKDYEVVLAAGEGKIDPDDQAEDSFKKTKKAIETHDKTITLSVGQLTTGITIPEWTGVLMLSNIKSPSLYMQAAFRSQNPCLFHEGTTFYRKENAYVFDFDPARTLTVIEQYANDITSDTVSGRGDIETRKQHIRELLNFFPVIGEDPDGELVELDAEQVMSVPRKIRCEEVVRRGFMSNFLFQNIDRIFNAPKEVMDIINTFEPVKAPKNTPDVKEGLSDDISLNDDGEIEIPQDKVIGLAADIFGDKKFAYLDEIETAVNTINETNTDTELDQFAKNLKGILSEHNKDKVDTAIGAFNGELSKTEGKRINTRLDQEAGRIIDQAMAGHKIDKSKAEKEHEQALQNRFNTGKTTAEIDKEFEQKMKQVDKKHKEELMQSLVEFSEHSEEKIVETVERSRKEKELSTFEERTRDRLRGFSRTIPSFLMAYGDDTVTLENFDKIIPDDVFQEVTSITLDQFRFLRDGGPYTDEETGEQMHFAGQLFDPVVFNDSVKEFLNKRRLLANYFNENQKEDIFDYVPPQKTNQIFTPKTVVKKMVDLLEEENPGCFDDPHKTFIDLYMKSGLYIAEIVKRLFRSDAMKKLYPNEEDRLRHIFEEQVYGLAPTEIIYNIAKNFILGFSDTIDIPKHNLKMADTLPAAKEGKLPELLDKLY